MPGREGFLAQLDVRPDLFNACQVRHKKNGNALKDFVVAENGEVDWTSSIGCFLQHTCATAETDPHVL